ncbi:MAG: apolipoprotein N-acyltransferase [Verrucomicrobiaceae bacterium]|nr:apolipoprotein N-acyltransferase [Verrucomicrobiaceae bacterium]
MKRLLNARLLLPLLSGGILVFALPGWNSQIAVWLWMFPLLAVLWPVAGSTFQVSGFKLGYFAGLAFFLPNLWWVRHSSRVMLGGARDGSWAGWGAELLGFGAVIGLAGYCAVYFGLWAWFVARFARPHHTTLTRDAWWPSTQHSLVCSFLASAAWVACEWLRSTTVFTGFGWNGLGVAFHQNPVLMQAADTVGVMGLSFLPVFVTCTAWNVITRFHAAYHGNGTCKTRVDFTVAMLLLLMTGGYGMLKVSEMHKPPHKLRIAMVQPNVAQVDTFTGDMAGRTYERLRDFTASYASSHDLVIWPESALPVNIRDKYEQLPPGWHAGFFDSFLKPDYALLTGTEIHEKDDVSHVSAVLMRGAFESRQEHHKVHLVPFGEYLPLRHVWPFSVLRPIFPADFTPGAKTEPLRLNEKVSLIPLICFEDTVGRVARRFVREEPQIIAAISNDGWFIDSIETEMHLANAKFRSVELRRPMARCSNIGVTCFIDEYGREVSRLHDPETGDTFIEGVLPGEVSADCSHLTFYARFGDLFAIILLGLCLLVVVLRWKGSRACPA